MTLKELIKDLPNGTVVEVIRGESPFVVCTFHKSAEEEMLKPYYFDDTSMSESEYFQCKDREVESYFWRETGIIENGIEIKFLDVTLKPVEGFPPYVIRDMTAEEKKAYDEYRKQWQLDNSSHPSTNLISGDIL